MREAWARLVALGGGCASPAARLDAFELDPCLATLASIACPQADVVTGSFFDALEDRSGGYDAVVGNPPYTRLQELGSIDDAGTEALAARLSRLCGVRLSRRASAYVHFLLAGATCLAPGGRLALVTPNAWLDVSAGRAVRELASGERVRLVAVIQPACERWFGDAVVNAVVTVLERIADGGGNGDPARFVTLEQPLAELGEPAALAEAILDPDVGAADGRFVTRLQTRAELIAAPTWSRPLREPAALSEVEASPELAESLVPLGELVQVSRGFTTGANSFFYVPATSELEPPLLAPLLKSPKDLRSYRVSAGDCRWRVFLAGDEPLPPRAAAHIENGDRQGLHTRANCAARKPWYRLPTQRSPNLVLAKGVWDRWVVAHVEGDLRIDQQLYGLYARPGLTDAHLRALWAILNTSWTLTQAELTGRTNFGQGVLWLATYEVAALRVPDPRSFTPASLADVADAMAAVAGHPVESRAVALARPEQRRLERAVLEATGVLRDHASVIADRLLEATLQLYDVRRNRAERGASDTEFAHGRSP